MSALTRETRETRVRVVLRRVATDAATPQIATGEPFLDHMLSTLARYAGVHLEVKAAGDLRHHLIEDVAITTGLALRRETPASCARYGAALVPMDEALVQAALDLGGRFYYQGPVPSSLYDHFLRSLAEHAAMTLHVRVLRGRDRHHVVEAAVKAVGLALRQALAVGADDPGRAASARTRSGAERQPHWTGNTVFSTKGAVEVAWEEDG